VSIYIENLTFAYGENLVLRDIYLHIKSGERIGVIGT
jgi:ATPase subunit of ABC transporter with duplicated ATPase domains